MLWPQWGVRQMGEEIRALGDQDRGTGVFLRVMIGGGTVGGRSLSCLHVLFLWLASEPAHVTSPVVGGPLWWRVCIDTVDCRS